MRQVQGDGALPPPAARAQGTDLTSSGTGLRGRLRDILPGSHPGRDLHHKSFAGLVHSEYTENSPHLIPPLNSTQYTWVTANTSLLNSDCRLRVQALVEIKPKVLESIDIIMSPGSKANSSWYHSVSRIVKGSLFKTNKQKKLK